MKEVGKMKPQKGGFKAFIPDSFPVEKMLLFDQRILRKSEEVRGKLGMLNGIAHHIPNIKFFIFMYINKDATASSRIEGTNASFKDVLESKVQYHHLPEDVDDILHYINALNKGLDVLKKLPISGRLMKIMHKELMTGVRTTQGNLAPGEFRKTQNWIGGEKPSDARFIPPPPGEIRRTFGDLEQFIHSKDPSLFPVIQAALIHAQFEAIHPFFDGNGRTGRMLITLFFAEKKILDEPLLYLSYYFDKHREEYYERLRGYTDGKVDEWVDFFLDATMEIAEDAIETIKRITMLREKDQGKILLLDKRSSKNSVKLLDHLFQLPVTNTTEVMKITSLTRAGAAYSIKKMEEIGILTKKGGRKKTNLYEYREYINLFN